jgi:hypothetical protein
MMNPNLGTSLTRAGIALQAISILVFLGLWLMAFQEFIAGRAAAMQYVLPGIIIPIPLWFLGLCGKVLADMHAYCYWSQENEMAKDARPVATI